MLTREQNERLTEVAPGTPMGELLRRYWWPICTAPELDKEPVQAVKLLGENLALYRTDEGKLGLVSQRCPHRGASLAYGIPEEDGLRCPYHGWRFDQTGQCNDMPAEPEDSTFKHRIRIPAYPVQEMGGLIWAYLGPEPVPLLPRFDLYARPDLRRNIGITRIPCHWLQVAENTMDPLHIEYLHMKYSNYVLRRQGKPEKPTRHHERIEFDLFEYGILKRRLWEGDTEDSQEWTIGHPQLFPNTAEVTLGPGHTQLQIRVPVDATNTLHYWYNTYETEPGTPPQVPSEIPLWDNPFQHADGTLVVDTANGQDIMAMTTQGPVSDRTTERLGTSDKGIIMYRQLFLDQMEKVARGEDPMGTVRDPAVNEPWIETPREDHVNFTTPIRGSVERYMRAATQDVGN